MSGPRQGGGERTGRSAEDVQRARDDERLLRRAEQALTEIKVAAGLSDEHASVLAALRIRLKGVADRSLDDLLTAAGDLSSRGLDELLDEPPAKPKRTLDDVLSQKPKPKREWPSG
jgi:MoxR-like ATPase